MSRPSSRLADDMDKANIPRPVRLGLASTRSLFCSTSFNWRSQCLAHIGYFGRHKDQTQALEHGGVPIGASSALHGDKIQRVGSADGINVRTHAVHSDPCERSRCTRHNGRDLTDPSRAGLVLPAADGPSIVISVWLGLDVLQGVYRSRPELRGRGASQIPSPSVPKTSTRGW